MADFTISTQELANAVQGFNLCAFDAMTPTGAHRLRVLKPELNRVFAAYSESRMAAVRKHATKGEDGEPLTQNEGREYAFTDEAKAAFIAELAPILAEPVTLVGCRPLTLADLGDCRISTQAMDLLGPFVIE